MPPSTFADRLAYARLVRHYVTGRDPDNAAIGKAVGFTGQWATKWASSPTPPPDYFKGKAIHAALAAFLEVDKSWLIDGSGDPPRPELWDDWFARRRSERTHHRIAATHGLDIAGKTPEPAPPSKKRASVSKRGRRK